MVSIYFYPPVVIKFGDFSMDGAEVFDKTAIFH